MDAYVPVRPTHDQNFSMLLLFGRKVAIEVADEHQKVSKVATQSKAMFLPGTFIADLMKAMP